MPSVPVYLFKDDSDPGRYAAPLATAGYAARTVPTLQTELLSAPLVPLIAPGGSAWEAVIITSRRAAEAWVQAVEEVEASGAHSPSEEDFVPWSHVPLYAPGPVVGRTLASLDARYRPSDTATGATSAAALAPLILDAPPRTRSSSSSSSSSSSYKPYLMLTGDKTLPTLPDALGRAGRSLTKVKVYATRPRAKLGEDIDALDNRTDAWAVLFSPSSAAAVVLLLNRRWRIRCHDDRESGEARRTIRLLAIGETTASYLRERFVCDAVAATPDPEGVLGALRGAEGGTDRSTDR